MLRLVRPPGKRDKILTEAVCLLECEAKAEHPVLGLKVRYVDSEMAHLRYSTNVVLSSPAKSTLSHSTNVLHHYVCTAEMLGEADSTGERSNS
jgi:hypothetical protein